MNLATKESANWILTEFNKRKLKNPALSLRSFARFLQMPASRLSELLSGKRTLTPGRAEMIAARLEFSPIQRTQFIDSVLADYKSTRKRIRKSTEQNSPIEPKYQTLREDVFQAISDWSHFAILSLIETDQFRNEENWIARRLNVSALQVREAIHRLLKLELIKETPSGRLRATHKNLATTNDIPSAALRKGHRAILGLAQSALDEVALELRDITTMILAMDPRDLDKAKKSIKKFRHRLTHELEKGSRKEVYALSIQLFPLSQKEYLK